MSLASLPFKIPAVFSLEELDLDREKFEQTFEQRIFFEDIERQVVQKLSVFELQVYDLMKQGLGREAIFKKLAFKNPKRYQKIRNKIRKLYAQYI